ncbi:hypothetical protein CAPTEDRAFT_219563 [Capitella teleta]|uniref:Ig-like domain-containing protein n=1 Tax=Capitella teleta TaxID=283909 RepID=R7ULF5_CAPTE|nr:hypothetical protein CAPTEDRAFT_219563 [Capitella teleta]|eukprot:ELU04092.1 hypothetical protein CAPTEDRAFT_219563 [Capitella teleta]
MLTQLSRRAECLIKASEHVLLFTSPRSEPKGLLISASTHIGAAARKGIMAPIVAARIFLAILVCLSVISVPVKASSSWDRKSVSAKQGDDVTITCTVTGLGPFDPVRVVKENGGTKIVVTENDNAKKPFSALTSRYVIHSTLTPNGDTYDGILTINYKAPVQSVDIVALKSSGEVTVAGGGYVVMREGDNMGVACVATADGSEKSPSLRLLMDGEDVTSRFEVTNLTDTEEGDGETTLGVWSSVARAEYRSTMPEASFNEKNFTCIASMPKFDSMVASAIMDIEFAPIITCPKYEHYGQTGESITVTCQVKANPGSTISWSFGDDKSRAETLKDDVDAGTTLTEKALSEDTVEISLVIYILEAKYFTSYYINAENDIDIADIRLELKEGAPKEEIDPGYSHGGQEPAEPQEVLGEKNSAPTCNPAYLLSLITGLLSLWL